LHTIDDELQKLFKQIVILRVIIGDPDDVSVDPSTFDSVQALDEAKLSLTAWLKTITRILLEEEHIIS